MLTIGEKIKIIEEKIEKAKTRAARTGTVRIVAVTKTVQVEKIENSLNFGITDIGENRIQEAEIKLPLLPKYKIKKHFIGHLQTNKAKKAVLLFDVIQSVDSFRLLEEINRQAENIKKAQDCLFEIKVSEENAKYGINPESLEELLEKSKSLKNVRMLGLMAIAPFFENPESARPYFRMAYKYYSLLTTRYSLSYLSMGMTGDYEIAVEEGSNMVRIGTGIYGDKI